MKTIYHIFGPAEREDPPGVMEEEIADKDSHPPAELSQNQISLISSKWYGDGSVYLEVYGYDRQAAIACWRAMRPKVLVKVMPLPAPKLADQTHLSLRKTRVCMMPDCYCDGTWHE